ncbi:MAG: nucleotide sugar dehydrogenase [Candidatus Odinarchaeota archaeon]|nr:nucleotide sugar dehydrogenase [Candidatus Odinarchaeota archaeon]
MKIYGLPKEEIKKHFDAGDITVGVFGLGKMGLPLAAMYGQLGLKVIGVDINQKVVNLINSGKSHLINEPGADTETISRLVNEKRLVATTDGLYAASQADVMIIIVPTLLDSNKQIILKPVLDVAKSIGEGMKEGSLVLTECTLPPGTTKNKILPLIESASGFKVGRDFGLAHSPERTMSGQVIKNVIESYPKIVGGVEEKSAEAATGFYESFVKKGVIKVTNATTAEAVKVFEGVYRDVNIGLANELAILSQRLGIDVMEAIAAANSQPYSHIHTPGAGVGGHCIPVYPYFLINLASTVNQSLAITYTARKVNEKMPHYMVSLVIESLNECKKPVNGTTIGVLGITYKKGVKSTYNSPALVVIPELKRLKANLIVHDSLYTSTEIEEILQVQGESNLEKLISEVECLVILTDHAEYKDEKTIENIKSSKKLCAVVDGRNVLNKKIFEETKIVYKAVGVN